MGKTAVSLELSNFAVDVFISFDRPWGGFNLLSSEVFLPGTSEKIEILSLISFFLSVVLIESTVVALNNLF